MKRLVSLLIALVLFPILFSCSKIETFGTLRVTVEAEEQRMFTLYVYPYSDYDNHYINNRVPIFKKEYDCQEMTEEIQLSPGNYLVDLLGGGGSCGVNIIAGKDSEVYFEL